MATCYELVINRLDLQIKLFCLNTAFIKYLYDYHIEEKHYFMANHVYECRPVHQPNNTSSYKN
jgi:hypothetical protein